jgi:DoxX-like family/Sigma-70 region 2
MSRDRLLATGQTGIAPFPMPVIRTTAGTELLTAVGLIMPWASGVLPMLTPLAAAGLAAVMVGAASSHLHLREPLTAGANMVILVGVRLHRCSSIHRALRTIGNDRSRTPVHSLDIQGLCRDLRPYGFAIAYRMLGSVSEAEDVVQEAFVRLSRAEADEIANPKAYLTTITTRMAIDAPLRSQPT